MQFFVMFLSIAVATCSLRLCIFSSFILIFFFQITLYGIIDDLLSLEKGYAQMSRISYHDALAPTIWAASCEKGSDDIFCPFLVLSSFAHFIPQIT